MEGGVIGGGEVGQGFIAKIGGFTRGLLMDILLDLYLKKQYYH